MRTLVIGGTGPTGPYVVNGLIERGHDVTIVHGGFHEVEFRQPVEHIHADAHFKETLEEALGPRTFDLIICMYGRLKIVTEVAKGRTGRFIAVGAATGGWARPEDPRWGPLGQPLNVTGDAAVMQTDPKVDRFGYLISAAEKAVMEAHGQGYFSATYMGYPDVYGARQMAPLDWCIVRRILDGRKQFIIADGGLKAETRAYAENAAYAVLLAVDKPEVSGGQRYGVGDETLYTIGQRIRLIARLMGHEWELVDMPYDLATPCHILWRRRRGHSIGDISKIKAELGYRDLVPAAEALARTVQWLLGNRPEPSGEVEMQLGDPFDYAKEDEIIQAWKETRAQFPQITYPLRSDAHIYRHPSRPGEPWHPPKQWHREHPSVI